MRFASRMLHRGGRTVLLLLLVYAGTLLLTRFAPGYFADVREMNAQYASVVRGELTTRRALDGSVTRMAASLVRSWAHGSFGQSRQYDVPVSELIRPRLLVTASLVSRATLSSFLFALALALPLSASPGPYADAFLSLSTAILLSIPIGALATLCLLCDTGGPALALAVLAGARDFSFLYRLLRLAWRAPHLVYARAQGLGSSRIAAAHLLPALVPHLLALGTMSFVLTLSAAVPAEVIFDVPGLGQLAWTAAMNRDAPVLLAVTLLMAAAVGLAGMLSESVRTGAHRLEAT